MPLTIGITGTKGKSTTMFLLKHCFRQLNKNVLSVSSTEGMYYNEEWLRHVYAHDYFDTVNKEHDVFLSEATSFMLKKNQYEYRPQDVSIFTGIEQYEHSDQHATFEDYFQSKKKLIDVTRLNGFIVINSDDKYSNNISFDYKGKIITYGTNVSDFLFSISEMTKKYMITSININKKMSIKIKSKILGIYNAYNIVAALSVLFNLGYDLKKSIESIESFNGIEGRFQKIDVINNSIAIIDYAHTDGSLKLVLELIKQLYPEKKLVTIFGCGGNKSIKKRPLMGQWAAKYSDHVIITNDNPRTEDPVNIVKDIIHGITTQNYEIIYDRKTAIKKGISIYNDAIILVAGKGSEKFLLFGDKKTEISDYTIIRDVLNENTIQ